MGIIDTIKKTFGKPIARSEDYKQYEREVRIKKMVEERMKSPNERDLEKHIEEERQKRIKAQLDMMRKKEKHEWWVKNTVQQKYMFKTDPKHEILRQKYIFNGKPIFTERGKI